MDADRVMPTDDHPIHSVLRISHGPARTVVFTSHKAKGFGYRTPSASHPEHELIYLDYGRMALMLAKRDIYLETGDVFIIPGGMWHHIRGVSQRPFNFLNVVFHGSLPRRLTGRILHLGTEERRLLLQLKEESEQNRPLAADLQLLTVNEFLLRMDRRLSWPLNKAVPMEGENRIRYRHSVVQRALDYLRQCSNRPLDAADVAAHVGLSTSHLRALVKQETNVSMRRHAREFRIETARRLLRESIDNVATVCYRVGYGSLPNFCTAFKRSVGMTPMEYSRSLGLPKLERSR